LREITHTARLRTGDSVAQVLEDLACPACGHRDPGEAFPSITDGTVRRFCDCCGAFVTIRLSEEQAGIVLRHGARSG
jgi:hypothetical protein